MPNRVKPSENISLHPAKNTGASQATSISRADGLPRNVVEMMIAVTTSGNGTKVHVKIVSHRCVAEIGATVAIMLDASKASVWTLLIRRKSAVRISGSRKSTKNRNASTPDRPSDA